MWDKRVKSKGLLGIASKTEQLEKLLIDSDLNFLVLSEKSPRTAFVIPGYHVFRKDRKLGRAGGVLLYVRDHLKCEEVHLNSLQDLESIAVSIVLSPPMSFTVVGIYRPPNCNNIFYDELTSVLKELGTKTKLLLLGDFNINWTKKANRKKLKSITDQYHL